MKESPPATGGGSVVGYRQHSNRREEVWPWTYRSIPNLVDSVAGLWKSSSSQTELNTNTMTC